MRPLALAVLRVHMLDYVSMTSDASYRKAHWAFDLMIFVRTLNSFLDIKQLFLITGPAVLRDLCRDFWGVQSFSPSPHLSLQGIPNDHLMCVALQPQPFWTTSPSFWGRRGLAAARYDVDLDKDSMDFTSVFFSMQTVWSWILYDNEVFKHFKNQPMIVFTQVGLAGGSPIRTQDGSRITFVQWPSVQFTCVDSSGYFIENTMQPQRKSFEILCPWS